MNIQQWQHELLKKMDGRRLVIFMPRHPDKTQKLAEASLRRLIWGEREDHNTDSEPKEEA